MNLQRDGRNQVLGRRAQLACELLQAEEVACVVELPIVRQERLDDEGVGHCLGMAELSFAGDEAGVVLARPAVIVLFRPIDGDAAEDDRDAVRGGDDVGGASFAVAQEGVLLPGIAEQIAGNRHLGEDDDVGMIRFRFFHLAQHVRGIGVRPSGLYFHLCGRDFQQGEAPLSKNNELVVMTFAGGDVNVFIIDGVNQSILHRDAPTPIAGKVVAQRFGFSQTLMSVSFDVLEERIDLLGDFAIFLNPLHEIVPRIF